MVLISLLEDYNEGLASPELAKTMIFILSERKFCFTLLHANQKLSESVHKTFPEARVHTRANDVKFFAEERERLPSETH